MRYLTDSILKDAREKMIILSGPRQSGKTTLAKFLSKNSGTYLNWDIRKDQKIIREIAWPKNSSLVVLDELHKYPKWKNFLKGITDEFQNDPPILVTGSARLETFRKEGDALTGRFFHYRLHPIDLIEVKDFFPKSSSKENLKRLLETGGFPEAVLNPEHAERLRNNRFDLVIQEDLRDLSKTNSIRGIQLLIEILRERTGQLINLSNIARDISVSSVTIKSWIELLERLYIIFIVPPYNKSFARSIRKEFKIYFYDCAAPYEAPQKLENVVASTLLKFIHFTMDTTGKKTELFFFRDREKREVDFVLVKNRKVQTALEIKTSEDELSSSLNYFKERVGDIQAMQLVMNLNRTKDIKGIQIVELSKGLTNLVETIF